MYNTLDLEKADRIYQICSRVVFESFDEGALVLRLEDRHLFELNSSACVIINQTNGTRSAGEIAFSLADIDKNITKDYLSDINELYKQLETQKIVELIDFSQDRRRTLSMAKNISQNIMYLCNPEVVLREEDEDGGLLFNPDTNQVKVVNNSGLLIWKQFGKEQRLDTVIAILQDTFGDTSYEEIMADARTFLADMVQSGFIGIVESVNK